MDMQVLQPNTLLQRGKYKIVKSLGQGGFGITYLAIQSGLEREVAIKEFFMKELCLRDESTSNVTLGTGGSKDTVSRFREKFLKEARNIAKLNHSNIVRVIDVFEENGTAYYVMEYAAGGSLAAKVKAQGHLSEPVATRYILQVADALDYIHQQKMNHLDVKPANIMLNEKDAAILIDFGLSKQYDASTGNQTSTTPVGISEGYAPMEQYKQGGVGSFSPETDIYSLGATFFKLLTGVTPPSASDVYEDGVPVDALKARGISQTAIDVICKAMEGRKKDRMKGVRTFIDALKNQESKPSSEPSDETTTFDDESTSFDIEAHKAEGVCKRKEAEEKAAKERAVKEKAEAESRAKAEAERKAREESERMPREDKEADQVAEKKSSGKTWMWIAAGVVIILIAIVIYNFVQKYQDANETEPINSELASQDIEPEPTIRTITESECEQKKVNAKERNIFDIYIRKDNSIALGSDENCDTAEVKRRTKEFVANPDNNPYLPELKPERIDFGNNNAASFMVTRDHVIYVHVNQDVDDNTYLLVRKTLIAAYNELRNEVANMRFGHNYVNCSSDEKVGLRKMYPINIYIVEP